MGWKGAVILKESLEKAKTLLFDGDFTFSLVNGERTLTSDKRGIAPVLTLLENDPDLLKNACIADKIIGKAAAMLLIYGGVKSIYTSTISLPAIEICNKHNIDLTYDVSVPLIKNRAGDGMCPMEASVMFVEKPERAFEVLQEAYAKMVKR